MAPDWREFTPATLLRNQHLMTIVPGYWPRRALLDGIPIESRLFTTDPKTQLLGFCHWQPNRTGCQTLLLVHGLEGSSESHYMQGIAAKAYRAGINVIRLNQRTCGGTEQLTPTLYNSGLSQDYRAIVQELASLDRLTRIWLVGYSMGGNLILKAAGELGSSEAALAGAIAVCPNIDPTQCAKALEEPRNWLYHYHFLTKLKARMKRKAALFPWRWDLTELDRIHLISQFDDRYTASDGGYASGPDYYDRAGSRHVLDKIAVPTTIVTAQDDPFIPYSMFSLAAIKRNPLIRLTSPRYGGHCGFIQGTQSNEDRFWVESRIVESIRTDRERDQAI
ncbi:MAG: alpha/beta fold hydrolase [Nitrospira sp.]|nr:alpha/beta fold hydrolase [Nitrospira sp.]MDW7655333.1 alpha/beta fold hydrolase [Nitrospiraceae bacterium]MBP0121146.1 alpha/beta fold hydrolase [Nitrospira sp.]MBP0124163.1 alpha/beta fold hydrolase [Nitrospira sp.]MBP0126787.1 alpha/beta fold hydrolase [Nitrospira sp.]